jgi:hypothetical protein
MALRRLNAQAQFSLAVPFPAEWHEELVRSLWERSYGWERVRNMRVTYKKLGVQNAPVYVRLASKFPLLCASAQQSQMLHRGGHVLWPRRVKYKFIRVEQLLWRILQMRNAVFWDVTPRGSCKNWHFGGIYSIHNPDEKNRQAVGIMTWRLQVHPKRRFFQEPCSVTSENTAFFIVAALKPSYFT